jgi:hypothetical protein
VPIDLVNPRSHVVGVAANYFFRGTSSVRRAMINGEIIPGRFVSITTDRLTEDQVVATLAASTSYGPGGLIQPLVATAYNPLDTTFFHRVSVKVTIEEVAEAA